jgi:hypothetical protein
MSVLKFFLTVQKLDMKVKINSENLRVQIPGYINPFVINGLVLILLLFLLLQTFIEFSELYII